MTHGEIYFEVAEMGVPACIHYHILLGTSTTLLVGVKEREK